MGCFPFFGSSNKNADFVYSTRIFPDRYKFAPNDKSLQNIRAPKFTLEELEAATKNFGPECLLGEGTLGRVFETHLDSINKVVAVKQLDPNNFKGNREFLVKVLRLSLLHDKNLVNLIGYCADNNQRLLVQEFMPFGSLKSHINKMPLDWNKRIKIAFEVAMGLDYLHNKTSPPLVHGDLKASNVLLDEDYSVKLSDFGLAKLGPEDENGPNRFTGTIGYCAPEFVITGETTMMSDVYSFGVIFLQLISGREAFDLTRPIHERNIVVWAQSLLGNRKNFSKIVDPLLKGYPLRGFHRALAIIGMCLVKEPSKRPIIGDIVVALTLEFNMKYNDEIDHSDPHYDKTRIVAPHRKMYYD